MSLFNFNPFKSNLNKRYNYTPRYYSGKSINNIYDFDPKLYKYKETYNANDFSNNWQNVRLEKRNRNNFSNSPLLMIIISILMFIFLYIIDFELSIFYL